LRGDLGVGPSAPHGLMALMISRFDNQRASFTPANANKIHLNEHKRE
jgi:hypothetical protein